MRDKTAKTLMSILAAILFFWVLTFARVAIERAGGGHTLLPWEKQ